MAETKIDALQWSNLIQVLGIIGSQLVKISRTLEGQFVPRDVIKKE